MPNRVLPRPLPKDGNRAFGPEALGRVVGPKAAPAENVERIYLTVLSRRPDAKERERMVQYVTRPGKPLDRYADVFWVLLNSGEFIINH